MSFKGQMNRFIVFIALIIIIITLSIGCMSIYINNKVKRVQKELNGIGTSVEGFFVDDCNGTLPGPDNHLPTRLTSPIAYFRTYYRDPFSPTNESYRYIDQPNRGNGAMFLVASRGPDRDWDVDRIPLGIKRYVPVEIPFDALYLKEAHNTIETQPPLIIDYKNVEYYVTRDGKKVIPSAKHKPSPEDIRSYKYLKYKTEYDEVSFNTSITLSDVEYYISHDGQRHDTPYTIFHDLPLPEKGSGWLTPKELQEFLASYKIAIYDPTNGIKSDGDIIFSNSR